MIMISRLIEMNSGSSLTIADNRDFLRIGDVRETALEQINHLDIVIGQTIPNEDRTVGLSQDALRLVPDLGNMGIPVILQMRGGDQ